MDGEQSEKCGKKIHAGCRSHAACSFNRSMLMSNYKQRKLGKKRGLKKRGEEKIKSSDWWGMGSISIRKILVQMGTKAKKEEKIRGGSFKGIGKKKQEEGE